ncbi:asparagine synthase-related protein [Rhabdothermincola salaria]|uniref:asparagine synthase-related protein n=1 Tax=Rhabdothermincola salaria TaxID=2903142 RepID=UPI001E4DA5BA|nr:asparagine synthase-related protein [Rhabdothermincola salaria]MCD9623386.1 asparagine synthase-related protein [Rhabdothermincola salaria]
MAQLRRAPEGAVASLGVRAGPPIADLRLGRVPDGTVAVALDAGTLLVGSGEGNQRLFQHRGPNGVLVSTHVGALAAALGPDLSLDRSYEDFLLGFGFLPDGRTVFEGVAVLARPAVFDVASGDELEAVPAESGPTEPADASDLAELVCEVVDQQAGSARTVGVLLGGFDSALVAAALHRTGRAVHTFTFSYAEPGFQQRHVEAAVAAARAEHHWVRFTPDLMGEALTTLPARLNQPSPQPHYQLQTIIAAEAARAAGAQAIFTGDGCDALFAAYPTINARANATTSLRRVPAPVRKAVLRLLGTRPVDRRLGHVARVGRSAVSASLLDGPAGLHLPTRYLDEVALHRLRVGGTGPTQSEPVDQVRRRLAEASRQTTSARLAVEGNTLTGQSQSKVEGVVARTGLPVFSPFVAPRFKEAFAALPTHRQQPHGRLRGAEGKPVLQEAAIAAGLLPEEVVYQPKQSPTEAPVDGWYAGPLRSTVLELLDDLPFAYDRAYVEEILRPKVAERVYRERVAISKHAFQAIGLLASYGSFSRLVT